MSIQRFSCLALFLVLFACKPDPKLASSGPESLEWRSVENVVRVGMASEPTSLNPLLSPSATTRYVGELIFQTLNDQDPESFAELPLLASLPDVDRQADGSVAYSYRIDEAARWPNGTAITATDAVFSIKLYLLPSVAAGAYRNYYKPITRIVTSPNDERRFKVIVMGGAMNTKQALASIILFPEYAYDPEKVLRGVRVGDLANDARVDAITEREDVRKFAERFTDSERNRTAAGLVGSGPYTVSAWEDGQRIELVKRPDYWAEDRRRPSFQALPEGITFKIIPDPTTMATAIRDDQVDAVISLKPEQFSALRQEEAVAERFHFKTMPGFIHFGVLLNTRDPLLQDVNTRRALAHLVDVDELIDVLFEGDLATRTVGPILPVKSYYHQDLSPIEYDPAKADSLLTSAGWSDSDGDETLDRMLNGERTDLELQMLIFASPTSETVGTLMKQWAAEAGVSIELISKDPRAVYTDYDKGEFDMGILGSGSDPNPDDLTQSWASSSVPPDGTNRSGFANAEADRLMRQIRNSDSAEERDPMYRRLQEIIYEQQPMIFLFSPLDRVVYSRRFATEPNGISPNLDFGTMRQMDWNRPGKE